MSWLTQLWATATAPTGGWLTNRAIRFFGHLVAMIVILYAAFNGTLTETLFAIYCAFIAGDASLAQALKTKAAEPPQA